MKTLAGQRKMEALVPSCSQRTGEHGTLIVMGSTPPDSAWPDSAWLDSALPDSARPDPAQPDPARPDPALPDPARPDSAPPDPSSPLQPGTPRCKLGQPREVILGVSLFILKPTLAAGWDFYVMVLCSAYKDVPLIGYYECA